MADPNVVIPEFSSGLSDWSGMLLDYAILDALVVGNLVRIQVEERPDSSASGWTNTPYLRITDVEGDQLSGVIDDPYRSEDDLGLPNGAVVQFRRPSVIEIPTDWEGNKNLAEIAVRTGEARMTGLLGPEA